MRKETGIKLRRLIERLILQEAPKYRRPYGSAILPAGTLNLKTGKTTLF
jgi:hypothetical protein